MKIYKLTGIDGDDVVLGENHLRPAHIVEIVRVDNDRTRITLRIPGTEAGFSLTDYKTHHYLVKETPADILAMIEAGEASSPGLAAERPRTITVDELLVGDHVVGLPLHDGEGAYHSSDGMRYFFNNIGGRVLSSLEKRTVSALLARGMQVYRDGKLISGWPVGEEPSGGNAVRVAELEAEVAKMGCDRVADKSEIMMLCDKILKWKDAASVDLADEGEEPVLRCKTPEELIERLRHLYRWATSMERRVNEEQREHEKKLAAIKSQPKPPESAATPELPQTMTISEGIEDVQAELALAIDKFPTWPTDPIHAMAVLNEEVGELNKAVLQRCYEPHKATFENIYEEARQAAAMAVRFLISIDKYKFQACSQHRQQETTAPESAATPERPQTMTVDELRVGDELRFDGIASEYRGPFDMTELSFVRNGERRSSPKNSTAEVLARGVQVYRDGKLISGWPIGGEPDNFDWQSCYRAAEADVKKHGARIAELEAEMKSWKDAANSGHLECAEAYVHDPDELAGRIDEFECRIKRLESELAAAKQTNAEWTEAANRNSHADRAQIASPDDLLYRVRWYEMELAAIKSQPQEVPPLDKWRVLATAKKITNDLSCEKEDGECVMWLMANEAISHPIAYTVGTPVPYEVK